MEFLVERQRVRQPYRPRESKVALMARSQQEMRQRQEQQRAANQPKPSPVLTPYSVEDVAKLTGFSKQIVTELFEREPGVLIYEVPRKRKRAGYRTIRIPRHVYERVLRRISL